MMDLSDAEVSLKIFYQLMVSVAFIIGILLMAAPDIFHAFDRTLRKEYGIKKRFLPRLENTSIDVIEKIALKNRMVTGVVLTVSSFVLLLLIK